MKFPNMFSPVQIGTVTVPNRFVVPPMGNDLANTDGSLSERSLSYYQARAKGGFGLITIESTVEKDSELGGNFRIASYPTGKGQISEAIRSMIVRAKQAGVNIRLNTEATEEPLRALAPDAVILATGSVPLVLPIPGLADCGYVTAQDLLLGKTAAGRRALVVGGALNLRQTASLEAKVLGHTSEYAFAVTEQTINTSILHVSMLRPASGLSEEEKQLAVRYLADSVLQHIDEVQALE